MTRIAAFACETLIRLLGWSFPPPLSLHLKLNQVSLIQLVSLGPGSPGRPGRPASPSGPRAPLQTVAASYAAIPQGILALWKPDRHSQGNCSPLEKNRPTSVERVLC